MERINEYVKLVELHFTSIEDIDNVLLILKNEGATQRDSVVAIIRALKWTLSETNKYVVNSFVWKENKGFHDMFGDVITSSDE